MSIRCKLYGHKWRFGKDAIYCDRCPATMVRKMPFCALPPNHAANLKRFTLVPLETLQVAETACREANYFKTAKELRKCLTAEK